MKNYPQYEALKDESLRLRGQLVPHVERSIVGRAHVILLRTSTVDDGAKKRGFHLLESPPCKYVKLLRAAA